MTRMEARVTRVVPIVVAIAVLGCGCTQGGNEPGSVGTQASTADEIATSSEKIDVGGRSLYLKCWGEQVAGEPAVLLIAGQGPPTSSWEPLASEFAADGHNLCAYDRAGVGGSDPPAEASRSVQDQVMELLALLDAADLQEPMVVVAHSLGSLPAVGLVAHSPERVAGVVLIDPWSPRVAAAQRAALPPEQPEESAELAEERRFLNDVLLDPAQNAEHLVVSSGDEQVAALLDAPGPIFGDIPVVVLQAPLPPPLPGLPADYHAASIAAYSAGFKEFADESTRGTLIEVENTGHNIHDDQPQAVLDAIRDVMAE